MKVVVTGAGGFIGRHLVAALLAAPPVGGRRLERLVRLDHALPPSSDERVTSLPGDIREDALRVQAFAEGADVVFHLAAVPGGAAERDPDLSREVNLDATHALIDAAVAARARFVYASTIAVLGNPTGPVDDATRPEPVMVYGQHKRLIELALADHAQAGRLASAAIRLPGIVARPRGGSGLKSAFLSDVFHALRSGEGFVSPVSARATLWLMSVRRAVENLTHASLPDTIATLGGIAVTLPALRVRMADLVETIAATTGADPAAVAYDPDPLLEAAFGALPPLTARDASRAGFRHDGSLPDLVATVLVDVAAPNMHLDPATRSLPTAPAEF